MRYVVSIISPINLDKSIRYLNSVHLLKSCTPVTVLVGFSGEQIAELKTKYPTIDFRPITTSDTHPDYEARYGAYLDAFPESKGTDVFVVVDTECVVQRDVSDYDWETIEISCTNKYIIVESSYLEGCYLPVKLQKAKAMGVFSSFIIHTIEYKDFLFMAARKHVISRIRQSYEDLYRKVGSRVLPKYRYSILMSYVIKILSLKYKGVPTRVYNKPEKDIGVFTSRNGIVYQYNDVVVFATDLIKTPEKPVPKPKQQEPVASRISMPEPTVEYTPSVTGMRCNCPECTARREGILANNNVQGRTQTYNSVLNNVWLTPYEYARIGSI